MTPVVGMGGSPSFCCRLSAMTRKTLRPIFILFRENRPKRKKSGPCTLYAKGAGRKKDRGNLIFLPNTVNQPRQQSLPWLQIPIQDP